MKRTGSSTRQGPVKRVSTAQRPEPVLPKPSAAVSVVTEPFLVDTIVGFLPLARKKTARRDDALGFFRTIQELMRLSRSARYARDNQTFWCEKLFAYFDFTLKRPRNSVLQFYDVNGIRVTYDPTWVAHMEARTKRLRRRFWLRDRDPENDVIEELPPDAFLTEEFQVWRYLYVYHRPSQYGFLTEIQSGKKSMDTFPASINAYELFEDMAVLVSELRVHALAEDPATRKLVAADPEIYPCLLRRMPKKVTPRGTDLLDVCAISATFWDSTARMVSTPWPGLSPESHRALMASRFGRDIDESEFEQPSETESQFDDFFGRWGGLNRTQLEAIVRRRFADWRHVRVHNDDGPQFYVGKRPGSSRWMGFISCSI